MAACLLLVAVRAWGQDTFGMTIDIERPGPRDFVLDHAGMLDPADREAIRARCDKLLTDTAIPIAVVTIESMAGHGAPNSSIETFATILFNQWGIGHATIGERSWNNGILLLVSERDRKARIELGADWGRGYDASCQWIMDKLIVAEFKLGRFSAGIVAGVEALDNMSRDLELPRPKPPPWFYPAVILATVLGIFTVVSMIRRGASGWAWLFWGAVFGVVGYMLYQAMQPSRGGGGFSGGSFGGGFSGGGGASGSW